jgi:hypothetical protein
MGISFIHFRGNGLDYLFLADSSMVSGFYLLRICDSGRKKLGQVGKKFGKLSI